MGLILPHYFTIGHILPRVRSDISNHLACAETLLLNSSAYNGYAYILFHIILSPLYIISNREFLYQVAGSLVFLNLLLGLAAYTFLKRMFSSSLPAFYGTLMILCGNLVWLSRIQDVFNEKLILLGPLIFDSRTNIVSYILIQFFPFSLVFTLLCFSLPIIMAMKREKSSIFRKILPVFFIFTTYLMHPLYAFLIHILFSFSLLARTCVSENDVFQYCSSNIILYIIVAAGFVPTLIAHIVPNASYTYRFQSAMFFILNTIACSLVLLLFKNMKLIMSAIEKFYKLSLMNFRYVLFLLIVCVWIYSLHTISTLENFDAWNLANNPIPLWLYPPLIGIGPILISTIVLISRNRNVIALSWISLLLPLLFVCIAPLVDYINFNILKMLKINGYTLYTGITSGRMLGIANLLYNMFGGATVGYAIKQSTRYRLSLIIGMTTLTLLLAWFSSISLMYWNEVYSLMVKRQAL